MNRHRPNNQAAVIRARNRSARISFDRLEERTLLSVAAPMIENDLGKSSALFEGSTTAARVPRYDSFAPNVPFAMSGRAASMATVGNSLIAENSVEPGVLIGATATAATVQFSSSSFTANVTDGTATLELTRGGDLSGTVTVDVSSTGGPDVAAFQKTVVFAPNAATAAVTVAIQNNGATGQPDVSIPLFLSTPSLGTTIGSPASATLTVHDNNAGSAGVTITSLQTPAIRVLIGRGKKVHTRSERVVELQLSGALENTGDLAAYQLLAGKPGKHVTKFSRTLRIKSAVYDSTAHTIMLMPAGRLALNQPLQLRVSSALLTDTAGQPLDGGENYVFTFGKGAVASVRP